MFCHFVPGGHPNSFFYSQSLSCHFLVGTLPQQFAQVIVQLSQCPFHFPCRRFRQLVAGQDIFSGNFVMMLSIKKDLTSTKEVCCQFRAQLRRPRREYTTMALRSARQETTGFLTENRFAQYVRLRFLYLGEPSSRHGKVALSLFSCLQGMQTGSSVR